jgi:hypothetical protein
MAQNYVRIHIDPPSVRINLTPELQELWNQIQFYEETQEYDRYDQAWDEFLSLTMSDILYQIEDDLTISRAKEYRGA